MMRDEDPEISTEEARRRFLWARRQGRPAWLWPDIEVGAWRSALGSIGRATAELLAGEPGADLFGDPSAIGLAGYTSGMGPLLGSWAEGGRLRTSVPVAEVLARHLEHNRVRTARMTAAAEQVVGRLADEGIELLVLKGFHTGLVHFPEADARPASDIDLLVTHGDVARAEALLERSGLACGARGRWESSWYEAGARREPRSLTYVHAGDAWSFDLHHSLNISVGDGSPLAALDRALPMASRDRWCLDPRARVLEPPLLLLHLATHAGAGWQNLTLLRQVELILVIRQAFTAGRVSWDTFLDLGVRTGATGYAYPALCLAERLAPGTVPRTVLATCESAAPNAVRRALEGLTPSTAQRIDRNSLEEHFMWATGWQGRLRMLAADMVPAVRSWSEVRRIYEARAWSLIRGTISP